MVAGRGKLFVSGKVRQRNPDTKLNIENTMNGIAGFSVLAYL